MENLGKRSALAAVITAIVVVVLFIWVDRPVSALASTLRHSLWAQWGTWISQLAHHQWLQLVGLVGLMWGSIDAYRNGWTKRSRGLVYVCLSFMVALLFGDVLKYFLGRCRPPLLFAHGQYGFDFLMTDDMHHSFPSGHTLRIFSLMTAIGLLFPRLRWALWGLALLVGISRVVVLRHYPSDVVCGAFIGIMSALWTWRLMMAQPAKGPAPPKA